MTTPAPQHRADGATTIGEGTGTAGTSTTDTAKDQARQTAGVAADQAKQTAASAADHARQTAGTAAEQARSVADTAKTEVGNVAAEAQRQARDLLSELTTQVSDQSRTQLSRVVTLLSSAGDELQQMASGGGGGTGPATDLVRQAATRLKTVSTHLEGHEPAELLDQLRSYARRRPGAFLLGAAAAGLLAGRLTKAARADGDGTTTASRPAVPATPTAHPSPAVTGTSQFDLDADVLPSSLTSGGPVVDPVEPGLSSLPGRTRGAGL